MHAIIRRYSGQGASQLFDELEGKRAEVEQVIRGVSGLVSYSLLRTGDGGVSVTVCQDKAGADESVRVAAEWIRQNTTASAGPPEVSDGPIILQIG
jgi:hypothetical protein